MSTPLINIDANPRQPGFKPTRLGSMIPNAPKFQRAGSVGRRSPFSVSTTGSPCYTDVPTDSKVAASPTPTSKLPRKSTPPQSAFSKSYTYGSRPIIPRTSLPRARNWQKPVAIVMIPSSNSSRTTSPLSCNKPLPSPPIAQFVNPASPPKAQRTLVDAEAGTPTEEVWPVLQPENVPPSKSPALSTDSKSPQRSMSEGSAFRRNETPILISRVTTPSVNNRTPDHMSELSTHDERMSHQRSSQTTASRAFNPMKPCAKPFHAFSTDANVAIDSPLTHKQQALPALAIPTRISSKRRSLPSPESAVDEVPTQLSASTRPTKSGCTKGPTLAAADENAKSQVPDKTSENDQRFTVEPKGSEPASFDGANVSQSPYGSIDSVSTWSLAAESFTVDESEANYKGTARVKRLSWHSSNPGSGPTLRISADADAFLLGRDDSVPAVPALPEHMLPRPLQERSIGNLSGHVSKQILVKLVPIAGSRTPTPSSTESETVENKPVKITPIRSMQPPRKPSSGDMSKESPALGTPTSTKVVKAHEAPGSSQAQPHGSFEICRGSSVILNKSGTPPFMSGMCSENDYEAGNYSTTLQNGVRQTALQMLGSDTDAPKLANRNRLPMTWKTPKSAKLNLKKSDTARSKTKALLRSTERASDRASAISTRSPSSASSNLAHSIPSQTGVRQLAPSRLGVTNSVAQNSGWINCVNSSKDIHIDEQVAADKTLRTQTKRSFQNIFGRRDPKSTPQLAKKQESKRSSVAGSALAQRIRNSTNLSKVILARPPEAKAESKDDGVVFLSHVEALDTENCQAALSNFESVPAQALIQPAPATQCDTAIVIHNILDHVTSMEECSPDRLRGLEIAEAVLHAVECSKEAKISAELARKHARDAELNVEHAGLELKRLEKLCEPGFDDETMQVVRHLIVAAGIVVPNAISND